MVTTKSASFVVVSNGSDGGRGDHSRLGEPVEVEVVLLLVVRRTQQQLQQLLTKHSVSFFRRRALKTSKVLLSYGLTQVKVT